MAAVPSTYDNVSCFHRRAVKVALQCQPDLLCLTMKIWAGVSPGHPQPGTAFSKVEQETLICAHIHNAYMHTQGQYYKKYQNIIYK